MMPILRSFVDQPELRPGILELSEEEARHLVQVRRVEPGADVLVLNGRGQTGRARVQSVGKRSAELELLEVERHPAPLPELTLCLGGLKQVAWDEVLRHAVELGLNRLVWLGSDHAVADVKSDRAEQKLARWRERLIQACKQSANPWLPELHVAPSVGAALRMFPAEHRWVASLQGGSSRVGDLTMPVEALQLWIGPEGDFSPAEYALLHEAGAVPVSLGPRILRAETAALALLARIRL